MNEPATVRVAPVLLAMVAWGLCSLMESFSLPVRTWPSREPAVCAKTAMAIAGHPSCLPTSGVPDSADESKRGPPIFGEACPQ
jgi:hypothetical protein